MDRLTMPALSGCTVMVFSGPFRVLQEERKSCLPNLRVVALYYLGKPGKGCKKGLGACPGLESPRRRNFVQVPLPLSVMSTDQVEVARFFREVFEWNPP
jgi:hypothetical protein